MNKNRSGRPALKLIVLVCLAIITGTALGGCGKKDEVSMKANAICEAYATKMESGQTTPEQDKEFIKAVREVVYQLDRSIRGEKKAKATRDSARMAISTGVDPNAPLKLFEELQKEDEAPKPSE